jgi:uncharacterized RDD family membrane protein YckC
MEKIIYAGFWTRAFAMIADTFMIVTPINYILAIFFGYDAFRGENPNQLALTIQLVLVAIAFAYVNSAERQSPGKKLAKIKVMDISLEGGISFWRGIFRFFAYTISFLSIIGFLLPIFRKDKRALHDIFLRTVVIYDI